MPAYSFGTSQRSNNKKSSSDGPGPGEYYGQKEHNKRPPQWRIGNQQRGQVSMNDAPGPGAYDNSFITKRQFPQYQFGIKTGNLDIQGITPGPGAYQQETDSIAKSSQQYSFGLRLERGGASEITDQMKGPGPAAYETNLSSVLRHGSRIGNQLRGELCESQINVVPGVGNYNVRPTTAGPFHRFGSTAKDYQFNLTQKQTPGPGSYVQQSTLCPIQSGKTMSIKHLPLPDERIRVPGPGEYEPYIEQVKRGNPKYRIGTAQRTNLSQHDLGVPGPGTYQSSTFDKKRPPSYKMGTESRGNIIDSQQPGPGAYMLKTDGFGLQYSLGLKTAQKINDDSPGPQDYHPLLVQTNMRPASCIVGSEKRNKVYGAASLVSNPGPSHYNLNRDLGGPKYPFGQESRLSQVGENVPGPGAYDIPAYFANNPEYLIPNFTQSQKSLSRVTK